FILTLLSAKSFVFFFFSSRRLHTRCYRDWSSDVCSSDLRLRRRDRGIPLSDPDAEVEVVAALLPPDEELVHPLAHRHRHTHRTRSEERRVGKEDNRRRKAKSDK